MSSHPDGGVPQGQQQLDISKADTIVCESVETHLLYQAFSFLKKKISALMSPTGKEAIVPIQVYSCGNCGIVPQNMLESAGLAKPGV